jgi:hypothetical protein
LSVLKNGAQLIVSLVNEIPYLQLLNDDKTNQYLFEEFLFHPIEVVVRIDFVREKNLFLTGFAQRKFILWKSCGLVSQISPAVY